MPAFSLCNGCLSQGYCQSLRTRIVTDAELANPEFIRDVRTHARGLKLTRDRWLSWLEDAYRDYPGVMIGDDKEDAPLDLGVFDTASIRYWFRDFIERETPADIRPRLRTEARERVRVFATLLRVMNPRAASLWGVRAANDSEQPVLIQRPLAAQSCRHKDRAVWSPPEPANDNARSSRPHEAPS